MESVIKKRKNLNHKIYLGRQCKEFQDVYFQGLIATREYQQVLVQLSSHI